MICGSPFCGLAIVTCVSRQTETQSVNLCHFAEVQGDFLVHFMDTAKDELTRKPSAMSVEKLQVSFFFYER